MSLILSSSQNSTSKMMMEYTKVKWLMAKNMVLVNTILRMETFMKDKCTREKCKEKESTHGQIRTYFKEHLSKTRWMVLASWSLPMEMHMKDNLSTIEHAEMERWSHIQVTPMRVSSWTISSKGKESSTWKMEISIKGSFSKENGMVVERFYFLMRQ